MWSAQCASYQVGAPADWVSIREASPAVPVGQDSFREGVAYLLRDSQHHLGNLEHYSHYSRQFITEEGIRSGSQIRIYFDPNYQKLTLHHVSLIRDGTPIDQLELARIEVIQRETELALQLYDGSVTAVIFPVDLRVGDILDYSFTIAGWNPVFEGKAVGSEPLEWSEAVALRSLRVVVPKGRNVNFRNQGADHRPRIIEREADIEYHWVASNQRAIRLDADLPAWFNPHAYVEWSEFSDWTDVIRWAKHLYPSNHTNAPEIVEMVDSLQKAHGSPIEAAREALRFVQGRVRYLGFEIGPNSHRPSSPVDVLRRRFGDCKDKVYLLSAILNRLEISAVPALVNTTQRERITDRLPSPLVFDHVICRVHIAGRYYWVDPTRSQQVGDWGELILPAYAKALVVADGETNLTDVPTTPHAVRSMKVEEEFTVRKGQPLIDLQVTTIYEGAEAERQRSQNSDMSRDELEKSYLNFYARFYPEIGTRGPIELSESTQENRVTLVERYTITNLWQPSDDPRFLTAEFYAWAVDEMLYKPATVVRTMPLAIAHPLKRQQRIRIKLAEEVGFEPDNQVVEGPGFTFRFKSAKQGNNLQLDYEYESRTNFLSASDSSEHIKRVVEASDSTAYAIPRSNPDAGFLAGGVNWPILIMGVLWSMLVGGAMVFAYRYRPAITSPPPLADLKPAGIGGWLILVAIGVALRPLLLGATIWQNAAAYSATNWLELTTPTSERYHPLWAPVLIGELLANIGLLGFAIIVLILFIQRRRTFRRFFIATLWLSAVVVALDCAVVWQLPVDAALPEETFRESIRTSVNAVLWSLYALKSRRVNNTFTN